MIKDSKDQKFRELLELIAQGNHKAFAQLYDLFWPELLNFILMKVNDTQVAEDIVHDLFVSLWNRRETILEIESIPAYFYSACRYMVFRYYRNKAIVNYTEEEREIEDQTQSLDERLYYRYLLDMVEKEVEKLPEKCKQIFKLSRYSYLTNKEIAEKLAISESTVENHINKAIKRLRASSYKVMKVFLFFF